ncbi:hypothetical protein [uncultured Bacteroides sp.]|uniref:hypothetical protein n=1 Tax=uncultured Bacteroides sp. TaxID=162156 RepID=UPI002AA8695A|nr:hypothetical protein [uncultured Bacteroides sp.]
MKRKTIKSALIMLMFLLSAFSCDSCKDDINLNELPAETHEGKNNIGCYVDGNLWVAYNNLAPIFQSDIWAAISKNDNQFKLFIEAKRRDTETGIGFVVLNPKENETLLIKNIGFHLIENGTCGGEYENIGSIFITKLDTIKNIVSGRFSFTLKCKDSNSVVNVTDGRFDISLRKEY